MNGLSAYRLSKVEQEKTDKMLIKSLEREERERKRVSTQLHRYLLCCWLSFMAMTCELLICPMLNGVNIFCSQLGTTCRLSLIVLLTPARSETCNCHNL